MKLDFLTPDELEAYNEWNSADERGGDCQGIGYAWMASHIYGEDSNYYTGGIVIVEDDQGFVIATTYDEREAYAARVADLMDADGQHAQAQEREEALSERRQELEDELEQANRACMNKCDSCDNSMVMGSYNVHEEGCPNVAKAQRITHALDTLED